ncbi:phosphatidylserine decarboxylase-related protein [Kipferlia bialata]|uniref:phosphatidylserine decarboxylase n=1 Tax=Kipferlia bialata TaxID=797122 RepID=A0A9K3GEH1_9EUKA|nr:phosphatidylserine decarboxylase-related protein [Kipferlia bialata]|eukprot:g528.t1
MVTADRPRLYSTSFYVYVLATCAVMSGYIAFGAATPVVRALGPVLLPVGVAGAVLLAHMGIKPSVKIGGPSFGSRLFLRVMASISTRSLSRAFGVITQHRHADWFRLRLLLWYSRSYHCQLHESPMPFQSAPSLSAWFDRPIYPSLRPICADAGVLVSPCDSRVVTGERCHGGVLTQVKGLEYSLSDLLDPEPFKLSIHKTPVLLKRERDSPEPSESSELDQPLSSISSVVSQDRHVLAERDSQLRSAILYLAPGDYHSIHAPCDMTVTSVTHCPGHLFPVNQAFMSYYPRLFAANERVIISGTWEHGAMHVCLIGAYNVGSMDLTFDPRVKTNIAGDTEVHRFSYADSPITLSKGEKLGRFRLGSTVVLVFEAPDSFEFGLCPHQKMQMGQEIGRV